MRPSLTFAPLLTLFLGVQSTAQVPPHTAVVGTISVPGQPIQQRGTTGIFLVPLPTPANAGVQTPVRITGLPADLAVPVSTFGGVYSLLHRPTDGVLFASALTQGVVEVHALTLQGASVASIQSFRVGTVAPRAVQGVGGLALFPDGRILVSMGGPSQYVAGSGPGATSVLAILDTDAGTLTAMPLSGTPMAGLSEPCLITPDGATAFVLSQANGGAAPWRLYEVDVAANSPTYGRTSLLYTFTSDQTMRPELTADGILRVVGTSIAQARSRMFEVDTTVRPVRVTSSPYLPQAAALFGPTTEPATGAAVFASAASTAGQGGIFANTLLVGDPQGGNLRLLADEPASGWGFPYAVDVHTSFERYGTPTEPRDTFRIVEAPNPGGLPQVGNANFSISIGGSGPAGASSWLMLGPTRQDATIAGFQMLVTPQVVLPMVPGATAVLPLPIPADPGLVGSSIFAQGVHLDGIGLASSDAVRLTLLR